MTKLEQAARQALEAFGEIEWSNNSQWQSDRAKTAITALREALEAAPQPTRQPLTDEQIQNIWCSAKIEGNQHGPFWFARAIEKAHGITNA